MGARPQGGQAQVAEARSRLHTGDRQAGRTTRRPANAWHEANERAWAKLNQQEEELRTPEKEKERRAASAAE